MTDKVENTGELAGPSLTPLVAIVNSALDAVNAKLDLPTPTSTSDFSEWYLAAMQALSITVASSDNNRPVLISDFQMMCRCALSASNLRQAVDLVSEFSELIHPRNGRQWLAERDSFATFYLDSMHSDNNAVSDLIDVTGLYAFYRLFQWLTGVEFNLQKVGLGPAEREDVMPFLHLFNASVLAGGDYYSLEFPAEVLDLPVIRTGQELPAFMATFPGQVFGSTGNDLVRQVRAMIMAAIQNSESIPSLKQLSKTLDIPESTFRRRLAESGMSFRGLREDCLQDRAKHYLAMEDVAIEDLSRRLGFSDDTSFRRAFRSWVGMSPTAWRKQECGDKKAVKPDS